MIYLLVKLSSHSNQLPKSLFVEGIEIGHSRDPTASGGFADIFCGTYAGAKVAVKRLRICNHQKAEIYKVSLLYISTKPVSDMPFPLAIRRFAGRRWSGGSSSTQTSSRSSVWTPAHFQRPGTYAWWRRGWHKGRSWTTSKQTRMRRVGTAIGWCVPRERAGAIVPTPQQLADIARGLTYLHSQKIVHGDVKAVSGTPLIDPSTFLTLCTGEHLHRRLPPCTYRRLRPGHRRRCNRGTHDDCQGQRDGPVHGARATRPGDRRLTANPRRRRLRLRLSLLLSEQCRAVLLLRSHAHGCSQLCTGRQPFSHLRSEYAVIVQVISGRRPSRPTGAECLEPGLSDELWELMERCWMHDPKQRPEMEKVLAYFAGCKNPGRPKIGSNSGTSSEVLRERHRPAAIQTSSSTASEAARGKRRARSPGSPPPQRAVKRVRIKKEEEVETNLQFGPQDEPDHRACQLCDRAKVCSQHRLHLRTL